MAPITVSLSPCCQSPGMTRSTCGPTHVTAKPCADARPGCGDKNARMTRQRAAQRFAAVVGSEHQLLSAAVAGHAMVEAFPNTFFGVLMPEAVLDRLPPGRSKSDRLYEAGVAEGIFTPSIEELGWPVAETVA